MEHKFVMERASKVSNIDDEVHFKQKQRLTITFTGNTLPHRKQSCQGAEDSIVETELFHGALKKP